MKTSDNDYDKNDNKSDKNDNKSDKNGNISDNNVNDVNNDGENFNKRSYQVFLPLVSKLTKYHSIVIKI